MSTLTILIYGRDASLLQTRQWLLESSGYRVLAAMELSEVKRMAVEEKIDLLILCHSLSTVETEQALAAVAPHREKIHTLIMAALSGARPAGASDEVLEAMAGPAKLVSIVGNLLNHQEPPKDAGGSRGVAA